MQRVQPESRARKIEISSPVPHPAAISVDEKEGMMTGSESPEYQG
jgi:hypothetical protein